MADPMSTSNVLNRYLFEDLSVRGELVQMDEAYQQIISSKEYPAPVQKLLGVPCSNPNLMRTTSTNFRHRQ